MVVDDPDRVRVYGDKAVMHRELERAGLALPRTIIWRPDQPSRDLTIAERAWLGQRIVCKPALGSGAGGVVLDMDGSCAALDDARDYDPDDHYLLQEFVTPLDLDGCPAWFRVYNCFGRIFACFWHPTTHETRLVTADEMAIYRLHELEQLSRTIALISGCTLVLDRDRPGRARRPARAAADRLPQQQVLYADPRRVWPARPARRGRRGGGPRAGRADLAARAQRRAAQFDSMQLHAA